MIERLRRIGKIGRVVAAGTFAVGVAACGPRQPTIESAEFICEGPIPILTAKITGVDKSREGGVVSASVVDPENRTVNVDLLRPESSQVIRQDRFNYGPNPQPFQAGDYTIRTIARRGTPLGTIEVVRVFDSKTVNLAENQCNQ